LASTRIGNMIFWLKRPKAIRDFGAQGFPDAPEQGSLDIKDVLDAAFAFA
jgi:hypothetical protein